MSDLLHDSAVSDFGFIESTGNRVNEQMLVEFIYSDPFLCLLRLVLQLNWLGRAVVPLIPAN